MILNEIKAVFGYGRETYTAVQWQYSYGQVLVIENLDLPDTFEAHFSKDYGGGTSKTQIGTDNRVTIPYEYFEQMGNIYCFIFLHEGEDDGETRYCITIPLKSRPKPTDEAPTEHEQTAIEQAIFALNTAVTEADGYAEEAEQSANDAQQYAQQAKESAESIDTSILATKAELANAKNELESSIDDIETSVTQLENDTLHLTAQSLTALQKARARANIDALGTADIVGIFYVTYGITKANAIMNALLNNRLPVIKYTDQADIYAPLVVKDGKNYEFYSVINDDIIQFKLIDGTWSQNRLENHSVTYDSQTLTDAQKEQARTNIGATGTAVATTSSAGLMSSQDKSRLDDLYADYSSAMTALGV